MCIILIFKLYVFSTVIVSFEDDDDSEVEFLPHADNNTIIVKSIAINLNEFS